MSNRSKLPASPELEKSLESFDDDEILCCLINRLESLVEAIGDNIEAGTARPSDNLLWYATRDASTMLRNALERFRPGFIRPVRDEHMKEMKDAACMHL